MTLPIAIIGAGPIGLELAVNLKAAGLSIVHFEAEAAAQMITRYPKGTRFFSSAHKIAICNQPFKDQDHPSREEYLRYLLSVAKHFKLELRSREAIVSVAKSDQGFLLESTCAPYRYMASAIIFAIGNMHSPSRLAIAGEDQDHVQHHLKDPAQYAGQSLLIIGGRNSAVESALRCHEHGAQVSLSYRGPSFDNGSVKPWLLQALQIATGKDRIAAYKRTVPVSIHSDHVLLRSLVTGETQDIRCDQVLVQIGYDMNSQLIDRMGAKKYQSGAEFVFAVNPNTMETSIPGVYLAGTAAAGQQDYIRLFIENAHSHVLRIVRQVTGQEPRFINQLAYDQLQSSAARIADIQRYLEAAATTINAPVPPTKHKALPDER
jgi:thioredoxin reductase (NADPH)